MKQFSNSAIQKTAEHFDEPSLRRGVQYAMEERVHLIKNDSWPVVAKVRGTTDYIVTVDFNSINHFLSSQCSCPVRSDCKHAAAAALAYFETCEHRNAARAGDAQAQAVGSWLAGLGEQLIPSRSSSPKKHIVAYILAPSELSSHESSSVDLSFHRTSILKRGGYARSSQMPSITEPSRRVPEWIRPDDLRIISAVRALTRASAFEAVHSVGKLDETIMREMSATGRLFWESVHSPPLRWGSIRKESLRWQATDNDPNEYRLGVDSALQLVLTQASLYLEHSTHTLGRIDLGVSAGTAVTLVSGPVVPREMLATAERSLRTILTTAVRDAVFPLPQGEELPLPPKPHLHVSIEKTNSGYRIQLTEEAVYLDQAFPLSVWAAMNSADNSTIVRDIAAEGRYAARLRALLETSAVTIPNRDPQSHKQILRTAQRIAHDIVPTLLAEGWLCEIAEDFPAQLPITDPVWVEDLSPVANTHDWFSLGLGVTIDGRTVQLLPILLEAIHDKRIHFDERGFSQHQPVGINLSLPSGELLYISSQRLARWIRPLLELRLRGLNQHNELLLPGFTAADLLLADNAPPFADHSALAKVRAQLAGLLDIQPVHESDNFAGTLRGYQRQGLAWLHFLHDKGYGGLLCDDMGLGKTVQLLAFAEGLHASASLSPSSSILVVAPRSILGNWLSETQRFAPTLTGSIHLGNDRARNESTLCKTKIVITSYQTLLRDIKLFASIQWASIILDEAQALKNPTTQLRRSVAKLKSRSRFCVTGTPIENHLEELWSQIDLIMPGLLGNRSTFGMVFRKPIEKYADHRSLQLLQKRIRPFLLRRLKKDVDVDLPEKTEILERVTFGGKQRDLYESLRVILDKNVRNALQERGVQGASLVILDALLRLRQCCCDPRLINLPEIKKSTGSAKLERLMSMLEELADAKRFVLVFSQFTTMLNLIEDECKQSNIGYVKLTGRTRNRDAVIRRFQAGEVPVFLISLKAGGTGLNLTRADTVIHYDPWWNPASENQATDRAHRIGQTKNVVVYKLVAEKTLEERICVMQKEKQQLTDSALTEGGLTHFSADDLHALFQSL